MIAEGYGNQGSHLPYVHTEKTDHVPVPAAIREQAARIRQRTAAQLADDAWFAVPDELRQSLLAQCTDRPVWHAACISWAVLTDAEKIAIGTLVRAISRGFAGGAAERLR